MGPALTEISVAARNQNQLKLFMWKEDLLDEYQNMSHEESNEELNNHFSGRVGTSVILGTSE